MRTRRISEARPDLPRTRPCLPPNEGGCGKVRMIVSRGLCDSCRKRQERRENSMMTASTGTQNKAEDTHKLMGKLLEVLNKFNVRRTDREQVLGLIMPYSGWSIEAQRALIRDHCKSADIEKQSEIERTSITAVSLGSSMAPDDSEVRVVDLEETIEAE